MRSTQGGEREGGNGEENVNGFILWLCETLKEQSLLLWTRMSSVVLPAQSNKYRQSPFPSSQFLSGSERRHEVVSNTDRGSQFQKKRPKKERCQWGMHSKGNWEDSSMQRHRWPQGVCLYRHTLSHSAICMKQNLVIFYGWSTGLEWVWKAVRFPGLNLEQLSIQVLTILLMVYHFKILGKRGDKCLNLPVVI